MAPNFGLPRAVPFTTTNMNHLTDIVQGNTTDAFMERVGVVREWFRMEEIEVSDLTLGRMASRLGDYEKSASSFLIQAMIDGVKGRITSEKEISDSRVDNVNADTDESFYQGENFALQSILSDLESAKEEITKNI